MLTKLFKLLYTTSAAITCLYSIDVFGPGLWSFIFLAIAFLVLLSIFVETINPITILIAKISGVLSVIALILLLIATTVGGSFNLSESNQVFGSMLFFMSLFGLSSFLWVGLSDGET